MPGTTGEQQGPWPRQTIKCLRSQFSAQDAPAARICSPEEYCVNRRKGLAYHQDKMVLAWLDNIQHN